MVAKRPTTRFFTMAVVEAGERFIVEFRVSQDERVLRPLAVRAARNKAQGSRMGPVTARVIARAGASADEEGGSDGA